MPVASESDLKDCEWVVERCKFHLKNDDRDGAKAWIITARSLFPDNFAVQVPARYNMHVPGSGRGGVIVSESLQAHDFERSNV